MKDFIFIAGAPGSGKSTTASALQKQLNSPLFEFAWIPEFRNKGKEELSYSEEESFSFENLILVSKNYAKHGFKNVIITDLNNKYIEQLPTIYADYNFSIFTLIIEDENILKARVLNESRSSGYRDWEQAIKINQSLIDRDAYKNEIFIKLKDKSIEHVITEILSKIN